MPVTVKVCFGHLPAEQAILDTGNSKTIIPWDMAQQLRLKLTPGAPEDGFGVGAQTYEPLLAVCPITFVADFGGTSLTIDADVRVVKGWPRLPMLGLKGCLNQIRFAIEPVSTTSEMGFFHFGRVSSNRRK